MSSTPNTTFISSDFETLLDAALTEYTEQTGIRLRDHPLASKIDSCDNPESILDTLQEQAQAFDKFRNGDTGLFKWLRPIVNTLHTLSNNAALSASVCLVSPETLVLLIPWTRTLYPRCFRSQMRFSPVF